MGFVFRQYLPGNFGLSFEYQITLAVLDFFQVINRTEVSVIGKSHKRTNHFLQGDIGYSQG